MSRGQEKFDVTVTHEFKPTYKAFFEEISLDKEFARIIKEKSLTNPKLLKEIPDSIKIRYAIAKYTKDQRIKRLKEQTESQNKQEV